MVAHWQCCGQGAAAGSQGSCGRRTRSVRKDPARRLIRPTRHPDPIQLQSTATTSIWKQRSPCKRLPLLICAAALRRTLTCKRSDPHHLWLSVIQSLSRDLRSFGAGMPPGRKRLKADTETAEQKVLTCCGILAVCSHQRLQQTDCCCYRCWWCRQSVWRLSCLAVTSRSCTTCLTAARPQR